VKLYGRRPLTKLERGLYAALAAIFIAIFASELLDYMELAERAAMEATLMNAVAAINVQTARDMLGSPKRDSDRTRNPFEFAGMAPANFAGELHGSLPPAGSWGYDSASAELIYAPRLHFKLHTSNGQPVLRFRVESGPGAVKRVVPIAPYEWG
jgi:hypothetical protein